VTKGAEIRSKTKLDDTLADIEAAVQAVASAGPVGVVGYCWGGTLAYAAACRTAGIKAAVGYLWRRHRRHARRESRKFR